MLLQFIEEMLTLIGGLIVIYIVYVFFTRKDDKPATDTPTMAHTALRDLVERAVDEARKLPALGATVSTGIQEDSSFPDQNYEELLATAILNKVIEKFQNERVDGNSNLLHGRPRSKHTNHENEIGLDEGVEEGGSSLEPLSQDECSSEGSGSRSRHIRPRQEPLSLTIEEQIEEVTTTYTSDDEIRCSKADVLDFRNARRVPFPEFGMDIVDPSQDSSEDSQEEANDSAPVDVITPVETWEENWLFQKRKIQTQSEPVSMLVPNPSADFRALIGDKDAEDTSDLSEFSAQSDEETEDDEDDDELAEAINSVVPKSSRIKKIDSDFSPYFRDIGKIDESSKRISNTEKPEFEVFVATVVENGERETSSPERTADDYRKRDESDRQEGRSIKLTSEDCLNGDSESSENRLEPENEILKENSEVPKTPASSPVRHSLSESAPEAPAGCDIWQLKEKLVSIDKTVDVEDDNREAIFSSSDKIGQEDKREEKIFVPSSPVNRYGESPTMNGCRKAVPRAEETDRPEDESTDQCDGAARISSQQDDRKIENVSSYEETERQCQALAQANADSASEKPSSGNPMTDEDIELAAPPRPGTIAEREHKKWENAPPIENNPYSEENIQKRLLERQYARRSSDVSGTSPKLQTSPSPPLQIVLGAGRPDFKRFGRDYYINEAKFPKGHSVGDNGFYTATSRPNSSLSQHSLSTGSDYEQQEMSRSIETDSTCSSSSEPRTKAMSDLQRNNVQAALRRGSMSAVKEYETEINTRIYRNDERRQSLNDVSREKSWNGGDWNDDILESERKNSKNEINAKLNNRENFEENNKPIRRIDLRAYGFENEFNVKNDEIEDDSRRSKRVVNKLDLRSFGYDSGLRRTQSNNNIDRRTSKTLHGRPNVRNFVGKSDFIEDNGNRRLSELQSFSSFEAASGDGILTKSTDILNDDARMECKKFGNMTAAKSVPNIGDLYSRIGDGVREVNCEEDCVNDTNNTETTDFVEENGRNENSKDLRNSKIIEENGRKDSFVAEESSMPSVRRLAQAFNKTERANPLPARKPPKSTSHPSKDRPTTPEIHIVDTPRQMHSLTARSLSREFREGLRQMTTKDTAPSRVKTIEQNRLLQVPSPTNPVGSSEDVSVISPGKLKNNIQFWEQLHRKS